MIFQRTFADGGSVPLAKWAFASRALGPLMRIWLRYPLACGLILSSLCLPLGASHADRSTRENLAASGEPRAQYDADRAKTIIELQQFRQIQTITAQGPGPQRGTVSLVNLNPDINAWFLLTLDWGGPNGRSSYHIENPDPDGQELRLADNELGGIVISNGERAVACDVWSGKPTALERARISSLPFAPLCNDHLYLRNQVAGHQTKLERVAEFLRDHVWSGEAIVGFVRENLYRDAFREAGEITEIPAATLTKSQPSDAPTPASVSAGYADKAVVPRDLGIDVVGPDSRQLGLGRWYPARNIRGVYVSLMQPQAIGNWIVARNKGAANELDFAEASALDYLVAFDLSQFDLRFMLGTDHPRVGWSPRPPVAVRNDKLAGPDGIGTAAPLVTTGMVSPAVLGRVVATFTGGFKRHHGAFKYGELATKNRGSHYGFIEEGVVFSKLQPGLATLYVLSDGSVQMKTWSEEDNHGLGPCQIRTTERSGVGRARSENRQPSSGRVDHQVGAGELVGVRRTRIAHVARRRLSSKHGRQAVSHLRIFLDRGHPRGWRRCSRPMAANTRCCWT